VGLFVKEEEEKKFEIIAVLKSRKHGREHCHFVPNVFRV